MNQDTKNKVLELKRVVNQKNDEIGQYIDEKDESIDKQAKELKSLIKEKKELKFRVEEARGNIAHLEMEIEKMQFDKLKSSLENESSASDIGKE